MFVFIGLEKVCLAMMEGVFVHLPFCVLLAFIFILLTCLFILFIYLLLLF